MKQADRTYPGIAAALPAIRWDSSDPVRLVNLAHAYHYLLHPDDRDLLQLVYLPIDHENLLSLLFDQKRFLAGGNFNEDELARIARGDTSPYPYWASFLHAFQHARWSFAEADRLLHTDYLAWLIQGPSPLLSAWARLSVQLRLSSWSQEDLPSWVRPDREQLTSLVGEEWPPLPEELNRTLRDTDLWAREQAIDRWLWDHLEQTIQFDPFSIDALVSYALRIFIASRWSAFQVTPGEQRLHHLITTITSN